MQQYVRDIVVLRLLDIQYLVQGHSFADVIGTCNCGYFLCQDHVCGRLPCQRYMTQFLIEFGLDGPVQVMGFVFPKINYPAYQVQVLGVSPADGKVWCGQGVLILLVSRWCVVLDTLLEKVESRLYKVLATVTVVWDLDHLYPGRVCIPVPSVQVRKQDMAQVFYCLPLFCCTLC